MTDQPFDLVIRGGRVIDPETERDEICDVAIKDGAIAAVGKDLPKGAKEIDASGKIVCPGFIDLHGHGQSLAADRMQAFDGVTTSLELEVGALPVGPWYERQAKAGRALNYGTAAAWIFARKAAMIGMQLDPNMAPIAQMGYGADDMRWSNDVAEDEQVEDIVERTRQGLEAGAIGIGIPNAYAPGAGVKEMTRICELAAETGTPTFTHVAYMSNIDPKSSQEAYMRLIAYAATTGAHMHICHLNSTSLQDIDRCAQLIRRAQEAGLPVTVEAYPYGAGSTVVSANFFMDPQFKKRLGADVSAIQRMTTGERFQTQEELLKEREEQPSELVIFHFLDLEQEPSHQDMLDTSVLYPGGAIASDALPWSMPDGSLYEGDAWPLPETATSHPRSAGCFTRFLRVYWREKKAVDLMEAIAKCTIIPARVIESCAPQIAKKARLQEGCDADVLVFDPETIGDRATFEEMTLPSVGVDLMLVNGEPLIEGGELLVDARPGRPMRREVAAHLAA